METEPALDLIIVGGGIGGVICLKYAKAAGLKTVLLEREDGVGGVWRHLPAWQDIQFRKEDWTLGDVPIQGVDQASILRNVEAWVERFGLEPLIRLNAPVTSARACDDGWSVIAGGTAYRSQFLVAATGGHCRPVLPQVERDRSEVVEYHSSTLRRPQDLRGRRVAVVGSGASSYDLIDLCFERGASSVAWIYRSNKWMRPTLKAKQFGTDVRRLAKYQMLGLPVSAINWLVNKDLRARYEKAGLLEIMPEGQFDIRRHQLIPGRPGMIRNFGNIERHRCEVKAIRGHALQLTDGKEIETDLLLWGTGYAADLDYLGVAAINMASGLNELGRRCFSGFLSIDAPRLFLLAPGVLETNTSTPWAYAHVAKSIVSHVSGRPVFDVPPSSAPAQHFDLVKLLASRDRRNYTFGLWYAKYLQLTIQHPASRPMPIP